MEKNAKLEWILKGYLL